MAKMTRFELYVKGQPTPFTGEWRHAGSFEAPHTDSARQVAWRYMEHCGATDVRVFTGTGTPARLVAEMRYSD